MVILICNPMGKQYRSVLSASPKALRAIATELFLEQAAIAVLVNSPERLAPDDVNANVKHIDSLKSTRELSDLISKLRHAVAEMRRNFGVRASRSELLGMIGWLERNTKHPQACYMPMGMISELLSHYDSLDFPPHARIAIDYLGIGRDYPGGFETRLLEASLFEDMCALFNLCKDAEAQIPSNLSIGSIARKVAAKRHAALKRATLSAAFYFIEGFMNCLAVDFVHKSGDSITDKDRAMLTEWDATKNRYRPVSTRDKLIQYPRIILRLQFPPLDENNCPELAYIVTVAKDFRDAIVHASASFDRLQGYPRKENLFGALGQHDVEVVVDNSISLVRRISDVVYGKNRNWLKNRGENGYFPEAVFE